MYQRHLLTRLQEDLRDFPAVALLGPRQTGKTTLARALAKERPSLYLDLESPTDRAKLADPETFLYRHLDRLVILDEVHRAPALFPVLRGIIDHGRQTGRRHGLFLLLGSAGLELLAQAGETLAGRIAFSELGPFHLGEVGPEHTARLWLRGGFPESWVARSDQASHRWRQQFIRTFLERDIPMSAPRLPPETLRRMWTILAHLQGSLLNVAELARGLGLDVRTTNRYLDLLVGTLLVRRLPPWHANVGKRLVKSPKIYVRDCGLVHALLGLPTEDALLGHPVVGGSWEGFVIEQVAAVCPPDVTCYFYRTAAGAEIDLLLAWPDGRLWALEIKRSAAAKVSRGFYLACDDLQPSQRYVLHPGSDTWPINENTEAIALGTLCERLMNASG